MISSLKIVLGKKNKVLISLIISDKVFNESLLNSPSNTWSASVSYNWEEKNSRVTMEKGNQSLNIIFYAYL